MAKVWEKVLFLGRSSFSWNLYMQASITMHYLYPSDQLTKDTAMNSSVVWYKITLVANLVQRMSLWENGTLEMASRTKLLPLDWSPQTISCKRVVYLLSPSAHKASMTFKSLIYFYVCKCFSFTELVIIIMMFYMYLFCANKMWRNPEKTCFWCSVLPDEAAMHHWWGKTICVLLISSWFFKYVEFCQNN